VSFLAPLFLAGLVALTVPILIHLTHRERTQPIPFPSLMFLRQVPFKTTRRQRIRHWLLFLLRAAAIILLVAAFARPLLNRADVGAGAAGNAREVVLLLDRSFSMGYGDRWTRATDAARRMVGGLGPDDRMTIVTFGQGAEAITQTTGDRAVLRAALDAVRPDAGATRFAPAFQLARDLLDQSALPRHDAILITDFQRSGWDGGADLRLPNGTSLAHVDVSDLAASNRAVSHVMLDRSPDGGGRVIITARVANLGSDAVTGLEVALAIEGQVLQTRRTDVAANATSLVRFDALALPPRAARGRVRIAPDQLTADDQYHFLVRPIPRIGVLVIEHPSATADETLFLRRALEIGRDPIFDLVTRRTSRLAAADLTDIAVVVVNDAAFPGGAAGQALADFVSRGGGLFVVRGPRGGALPAAWTDSVGGTIGTPIDRFDDRGGTLSIADYAHPVFQPFRLPRSGDFSAARFFRYRRFAAAPGTAVLARLDDGAVVLAEARYGNGRVMQLATGLDNQWNDLPLQPIFLPYVHQTVRYLARFVEPPAWYTAGQVAELGTIGAAPGVEWVVETPSGHRSATVVDSTGEHLTLRETGFYEVRQLDDARAPPLSIAVNPDATESDITPLDRDALLAAAAPRETAPSLSVAESAGLTTVERERRQGLWWYLLLVGFVILGVETVLANRAKGPR